MNPKELWNFSTEIELKRWILFLLVDYDNSDISSSENLKDITNNLQMWHLLN